jgi:hypothetical protein
LKLNLKKLKVIKLIKNQSNIIVLTLTERCTLTNPLFLFRFINDESKVSYSFIGVDTSLHTDRYNRFTITEKLNPTLTQSEVYLPLNGFYHYEIYEQTSPTNLDYTLAVGIVETGKVKVIGTESSTTAYDNQTKINIIYNG